ncbi:hypothetical protein QZH56_30295 [Streptomyces olivoreticuli]|uniref:mevalonate kinase family protein n=1 Tax=Streptomyces olivoreticuli TaxID=68246 RepID=UPI002658A511|nr:hypothetical protein [Streptomyces olivoreticuli]WKK22995.1 hypothetical protein QZH56_30295 [Streptomyces olivoreticuli]
MRAAATATAPGRLCLAGESLDWMNGGSSVVATIPLRTKVTAWRTPGDALTLLSGSPVFANRLVSAEQVAEGKYSGDQLDYMQAAARVTLKTADQIAGTVLTAVTDMPVAAGLSSSAAVTVASVTALSAMNGAAPDLASICRMSRAAETGELGSGAGWMDYVAVAFGGVSHVSAGERPGAHGIAPTLGVPVVIVDTLQPRTTLRALSSKRERYAAGDASMHAYARQAADLVESVTHALCQQEVDYRLVGRLLTTGHGLLRDLVRCSTPLIDECAARMLHAGALGAKLSGSGYGGCLFALVPDEAINSVLGALDGLPVHAHVLPSSEPEGVTVTRLAGPVPQDANSA